MPLTQQEFKQIQAILLDGSGISIGDTKAYLVENRLSGLLVEYNLATFYDLFVKARSDPSSKLIERIIDLMTTNETLWFRDNHPFITFQKKLLPEYIAELKSGKRRKVRIWSAASSTGQEPYSLSMIIQDAIRVNPFLNDFMFEILASDISQTVLDTAIKGQYDQVAISRGLPDDFRNRYFVNCGKKWSVTDSVKKLVKFQKINLQSRFNNLGKFDLILCRNVAIYFSRDFKVELFAKFAAILEQDGIFFLGASEALSGYSSEFEILKYKKGFYYKVLKGVKK